MHRFHAGLKVAPIVLSLVVAASACGSTARATAVKPTSATATHPRPAFPATVRAANGTVTLPARPTAIVSLSPTATEMLYAIGAGAQVKAVDSYSDYPPGVPVTKLNGSAPNVEAIAKERPDLVVVSTDTSGFDAQMANLHIPVLFDPAAATLSQAYQQYLGLGAATGNLPAAKSEVARLRAKVTHIVATAPRLPGGATYYYELDPTYYSVTSATFVGQVLGLLGLRSIADRAQGAAASGGYPQISPEFVVQSNPAYVFLADTICCGANAGSYGDRPGFSALGAVRYGRIIALNDDIASRWGPRITVLLQEAADALRTHPAVRAA